MPKVLNCRDFCVVRDGKKRVELPPNAVYCGRAVPRYALKASPWANSVRIEREADRPANVAQFRRRLTGNLPPVLFHATECAKALRHDLGGRDLACWCAPKACHCDIYLELANEEA